MNEKGWGDMQLLATQSYEKVIREITRIGKTEIKDQRIMYLYRDKLVTKHRSFLTENVIDVSYREIGEAGGMLYVHTTSGVFPYTVKSSPEAFIHIFKMEFGRK